MGTAGGTPGPFEFPRPLCIASTHPGGSRAVTKHLSKHLARRFASHAVWLGGLDAEIGPFFSSVSPEQAWA